MKKLLFILLLVPILEAKEYTFSCEYEKYQGSSTKSMLVNTNEKYILLNGLKYADEWKENEATVSASMRYTTTVINTLKLDKITGKMKKSTGKNHSVYQNYKIILLFYHQQVLSMELLMMLITLAKQL